MRRFLVLGTQGDKTLEKTEEVKAIREMLKHPETLGTKTSIYTRVTGYYRNVADFNNGKKNEVKDRKSFKIL